MSSKTVAKHKRKRTPKGVLFCVWLGRSRFACRSASAKREAGWGSHSTCENFVGEHSICSRKNGRIWNPPLRSRRRACESRSEAELPLCRSFQNYSSTASGPPSLTREGFKPAPNFPQTPCNLPYFMLY